MKKLLPFIVIMLVMVGQCIAQPLPPPPPNTQIPLDVVVSLLIVAGIIFGGIRLSRRKNVLKGAKSA